MISDSRIFINALTWFLDDVGPYPFNHCKQVSSGGYAQLYELWQADRETDDDTPIQRIQLNAVSALGVSAGNEIRSQADQLFNGLRELEDSIYERLEKWHWESERLIIDDHGVQFVFDDSTRDKLSQLRQSAVILKSVLEDKSKPTADPQIIQWADDIAEDRRLATEGFSTRSPERKKIYDTVGQRKRDNPEKYQLAMDYLESSQNPIV